MTDIACIMVVPQDYNEVENFLSPSDVMALVELVTRLELRRQIALSWVWMKLTDIKELPEVVPEQLTNKEMLELEHKYLAGEEAREKETAGE